MREHRERRRLAYGPDAMFKVVADVERYPEFLPWVTRLKVLKRETVAPGHERLRAEMRVSFKLYNETFVTDVDLRSAERRIDVDYKSGPFRHLENRWLFEPADPGCTVDFFIGFEFRNRMFQVAAQRFLNLAVGRLAAAFEQRAHTLYRTTSRTDDAAETSRA